MKILIIFIILSLVQISLDAQVTTNIEAKEQLREWGIFSSKIITDAEKIVVEYGQITGSGGITISLPILEIIDDKNIILLTGSSGYKTKKGTIIIEADFLYISAIVFKSGVAKYLIVGQSLKDIVNYLLSS